MIRPSDVIRATGSDPNKPLHPKTNPMGTGHILNIGRVFKCAGIDEGDGPTQQHTIMTLVGVPSDGKEHGVVPTERADEATWDLDEAQTAMDPSNPVCQLCGQPPVS